MGRVDIQGRAWQTERAASVKALRLECAWLIHRRAKSNQLDIATEILLSWREYQSNYQRLLLKNERGE